MLGTLPLSLDNLGLTLPQDSSTTKANIEMNKAIKSILNLIKKDDQFSN